MLSTLLGSETRARIIRLLLSRRAEPFYVRELVREAGMGTSGVQRELHRLQRLGLVTLEPGEGGRRVIRVVDGHPFLVPLEQLIAAEAQVPRARARGDAGVREAMQPDPATLLNPRLRERLPAILDACLRAGAERVVLFGSTTQTDPAVEPHDVDIVVRLGGPAVGRGARYFALRDELERAAGLTVDLLEEDGLTNPYLRAEIERSGVVIHEAA
jgi:hypothetical protein